MAPTKHDLYQTLGLERSASAEEVRKAYRRKALQTHPDRLPKDATDQDIQNAAEDFRIVNNAYEVLSNETNRKLYDQHGVWPPPNVQSQQPDPFDYFDAFGSRARHHNTPRYAGYRSPFDEDPFFAGFNRRHDQFRFTDPFVIFDQMFRDFEAAAGFRPNQQRRRTDPFNSFFGNADPFFGGFSGNPQYHDTFGHGPSSLMNPFGNNDLFGGGFGHSGMLPMIGFSNSSSFQSSSFGNGGSSQRMEIRSQTINGVTHTVKKRVDGDGNQHEERTYPDGRKEIFYNGVLQGSEPAKIEGSSRKRHRSTRRIEAPPPPPPPHYYPEPQTAEKKKHWWSGR